MVFVENIILDGLLIGLAATIVMTAVMLILRRKMDMHIAEILGEMILIGRVKPKTEVTVGMIIHIVVGILLGLIYVLLFPAGIIFGVLYALLLWLILMLAIMPLSDYGIFAKNLSDNVWVYTLVLHMIYGLVLGFIAAI